MWNLLVASPKRASNGPNQQARRSRFGTALPRRSLLVRLLAVSAFVSVCSITATAWVVLNTTAVVIGKGHGQALADDARIYNTLMGWASPHPDWSGVGPAVEQLGQQVGHRVVLTAEDGRILADSGPASGHAFQRPKSATAKVNPLASDSELSKATSNRTQTTSTTTIDPRAVGPFRLSTKDSQLLLQVARRATGCLRREGLYSGTWACGGILRRLR